jgi:pimeloyl-ACP methyl ester carboxylesterase
MECRLNNVTIYYEQLGVGRPLLLLHGWPADHRIEVKAFEPLFEQRDGWKRIYPDMPGMGKTPGPDWITNQDQMLDVLLEFIDTVIPKQHFCVAGTSYGGYLAQGLIYRRPEMVDGALFLVPMMGVNAEDRSLPEHVTLVEDKDLLSELSKEEAAYFQGMVVQSRERLETIRRYLLPAFEIADHEFLEKVAEHYLFSFDTNNLPRPFEKPALFLLGRQDSMIGYIDAWRVIENYPRASFIVLDRAGHGLAGEQTGLFRSLAGEWLDRVEESSPQAK